MSSAAGRRLKRLGGCGQSRRVTTRRRCRWRRERRDSNDSKTRQVVVSLAWRDVSLAGSARTSAQSPRKVAAVQAASGLAGLSEELTRKKEVAGVGVSTN